MAKQSRQHKSTDELKGEVSRSRDRVARDLRAMRLELDIPRKLRRSFQQQTVVWITAAVVVGAILVYLPRRTKKVTVEPKLGKRSSKKDRLLETGFALGALKFAATLLKPVVVSFITQKVRNYSGEHGARRKW